MSKTKRKAAKSAPITANPLFPAVVALWFGALFGLGSLAVRASLLEDLVLKSHIDLVVPAAAPPLGVTARILLALVLAALGAMLGIALARRLARPKTEDRERKRGAKDLSAPSPRVRSRDAHPDAPARRPISAHEEFGDEEPFEPARPAGGVLANRRRALAMAEDEPQFVPHEAAPLPGLDTVQPLDLASLSLPAEQPVAAGSEPQAPPSVPAPSLDWSRPAPVAANIEHAPISAEAAHEAGRQVFGMTPPPAPEAAPRQIFGIQAEGDHVPQDFVQAAGFQTTVFDAPEPSPLFARAIETPAAVEPAPEFAAPAPQPVAEVMEQKPAPESAAAFTVPVQPVFEPAPEAAESAPVVAAAAPQAVEPLPSPSSLGMTDLAARLADSMRRRRERTQGIAAPTVAATKPQAAPEAPAPAPTPSQFEPAAAAPAELPPMPAAFAAPVEAPVAPAVAAVEAPKPLPRFGAPETAPEPEAATAPLAMPAAMRPLALDAFLEDDAALEDSSLLPPRHIAMPPAASAPAPFAAPSPAEISVPVPAAFAAPERDTSHGASLDDAAEDNPYASLLGVSPARQGHVRIDEPEPAADAEIEPVVIFPGQTGQVVPLAAAPPPVAEETGFRRFDAPETAGQGQPVAAANAAPLIPAGEAAQALRAALSNLQRMSGAA